MYLIDDTLVLRAIEKEDNGLLKEMINNPEIEKMVVGWSFPASDMRQDKWYENTIFNNGEVKYIIEYNGVAVGMAAITRIDFKNSTANIDIKIANEENKKQGIGYRTVSLLKKYSFEELNLHCLTASILEENIASRKLFEKSGFVLEGKRRNRVYKAGTYHNLYDYSILKDEYVGCMK